LSLIGWADIYSNSELEEMLMDEIDKLDTEYRKKELQIKPYRRLCCV